MPRLAAIGRWVLVAVLVASVWQSARAAMQIATNPALTPFKARGAAEIVAITDRMVAQAGTPDRLQTLFAQRLSEKPRNWVALQALAEVAQDLGQPLPPTYDAAWQEDSGLLALTENCLTCVWDIAMCSLSTALICKAPVLLTPVEDARGLIRAGLDYASGTPVDRLDFGLSVVGLGATAALLASGGSSAPLKAGTATIRLARGMGRLSPTLTARLTATFRDGIRWTDLPKVRTSEDLAGLVRVAALKPLAATLSDLGRMADAIGPVQSLHLLPLVDDAADARRIADAAQALGPRTVSRAEVLGKTRLLRATLRYGDTTVRLMTGLVAALVSGAMLVAGMVQGAVLGLLHKRRFVT